MLVNTSCPFKRKSLNNTESSNTVLSIFAKRILYEFPLKLKTNSFDFCCDAYFSNKAEHLKVTKNTAKERTTTVVKKPLCKTANNRR